MSYIQIKYDVRCEWGLRGVEVLAPVSDVIIIVDILSFSTSVDIACGNGAEVYPFSWKDESSEDYAQSLNAVLADSRRSKTEYSLSPSSLTDISVETKLVLPSPNGSTLSLAAGNILTLCGCLRNCEAVADYAMKIGKSISVIPAGERWEDGSIRFAVEDLIGAGAIISRLKGNLSPEAEIAEKAYVSSKNDIGRIILNSISGRELAERGFEEDVHLSLEIDRSNAVPLLVEGKYVNVNKPN